MARTSIANADLGSSVRGKLNTLFCNPTAADPTTASDNTQGYDVGSTWFNTATGVFWECHDATTNAAKWQKIANGTAASFRTLSAVWYDLFDDAARGAGLSSFATDLYLFPFTIRERVTLTDIGVGITTLSAVGGGADVCMAGIYAHNAATARPTGAALASVTGLSTTATGGVSATLGAAVTFDPGTYWAAGQANNTTVRVLSVTQTTGADIATRIGSTLLANIARTATVQLVVSGNTYGTFPDLTAATFTENNSTARQPRLFGKVQ